jgi:hypothetical protein
VIREIVLFLIRGLLVVAVLFPAWYFLCMAAGYWKRFGQRRGKPPLAHLAGDDALKSRAPRRGSRRWPAPDRDFDELASSNRCGAYARLAREVGELRAEQGEAVRFIAAGLLGATLPHHFDRNHAWALGFLGAALLFVTGSRLRSRAHDWQRRAAFYEQRANALEQQMSEVASPEPHSAGLTSRLLMSWVARVVQRCGRSSSRRIPASTRPRPGLGSAGR